VIRLALVLAAALLVPDLAAAPVRPAASGPRAPVAPPPGLGAHASLLEGTWEFRSLTRPDGVSLAPPAASGVIVIDRGVVLAASYVQASPERKVGSVWEGRMVFGEGTFEVIPEKGFRYDSKSDPPVNPSVPPRTRGRIEHPAEGGLRMVRDDGGSVTFEPGGRRVQKDSDGTVIVHERTSLTPRVPEDLPGR
jgi:hypothetical protein